MNLVLSGPIDSALLAAVERWSRPSRGVPVRQHAWRFEAVDDSPAVRREVAALCESSTVDHAYVEPGVRFSDMKLLALDMDSTLITIECIDELADFAGKRAEVAAITEATMRGEIPDFAESLRRRVALLRGLDADVLRRVYDERLRLSPGAEALVSAAKSYGLHVLVASGGFSYFADRLKASLQLDAAFANCLHIVDGKLTGKLLGEIVDALSKALHVRQAMQKVGATTKTAVVIGDGANDLAMMQCVKHSIAYRAKSVIQESAEMAIRFGSIATTLDFLSES